MMLHSDIDRVGPRYGGGAGVGASLQILVSWRVFLKLKVSAAHAHGRTESETVVFNPLKKAGNSTLGLV